MDWTVQIVLRPGNTLLEEHVHPHNHSDARHHYFWSNNTGVEVCPTRALLPDAVHQGQRLDDIDTWPVNSKGIDLSLVSRAGEFEAFAYAALSPSWASTVAQ